MILYSYNVYDSIREDGVGVYLSHGELVPVGSDRYVRLPHAGTMLPADETWTACRHTAKRRAAAKVQQMADKLAAQAERLMQEAEREERSESVQGVAR